MNGTLRILKVQKVGDFYRKHTKPSLLLTGNWLRDAGIIEESRVSVSNPEPGVIIISAIHLEGCSQDIGG